MHCECALAIGWVIDKNGGGGLAKTESWRIVGILTEGQQGNNGSDKEFRMRFEEQANTTAIRMKKSAEAAFRRGDADRLKEILERANEYKERMNIRRLNARNTVHYNLGYENDAANASWLVDIVEGLIGRMA